MGAYMKAVDGHCGSWAIRPPQHDRRQSLQSPRPLNHGGQLQLDLSHTCPAAQAAAMIITGLAMGSSSYDRCALWLGTHGGAVVVWSGPKNQGPISTKRELSSPKDWAASGAAYGREMVQLKAFRSLLLINVRDFVRRDEEHVALRRASVTPPPFILRMVEDGFAPTMW